MANLKSPWGQYAANDSDSPINDEPQAPQGTPSSLDSRKAGWQVEAAESLLNVLNQERAKAIDTFFQTSYPAFPNKILAMMSLDEILEPVDQLINAAEIMFEGGLQPKDILRDFGIDVDTEMDESEAEDGHSTPQQYCAEILQLEALKMGTDVKTDFQAQTALQLHTMIEAYVQYLSTECNAHDDVFPFFDGVLNSVEDYVEGRALPKYKAPDASRWPFVQELFSLAQVFDGLAHQSLAMAAQLIEQERLSPLHQHDQIHKAAALNDGIQLLSECLRDNLVIGIHDMVYMHDLSAQCDAMIEGIGQQAEDPESNIDFPVHMALQIKTSALIQRITEELLLDEEVMAENPLLLATLPEAGAAIFAQVCEAYPAPSLKDLAPQKKRENKQPQKRKKNTGAPRP
jgi:hypothetical protein